MAFTVFSLAAFVSNKSSLLSHGSSSFAGTAVKTLGFLPQGSQASTNSITVMSLHLGAGVLADYSLDAIKYFNSIRIPAALVAGSSLAALFSLKDQAVGSQSLTQTRAQRLALVAYHFCALSALMLSLNVVVSATASSNYLLLGASNPMAPSAYAFLQREFEYEFLLTRWCFFSGLFSFLSCVAMRVLVEFELLSRKRWRSASMVVFGVGSLILHLLSFVNTHLHCWSNLGEMTVEVLRVYLYRSFVKRNPTEIMSVLCFFGFVTSSTLTFKRALRPTDDILGEEPPETEPCEEDPPATEILAEDQPN